MSSFATGADHYLRYSDGLEEIETDEQETFQKIGKLMSDGADTVHSRSAFPTRSRTGRLSESW